MTCFFNFLCKENIFLLVRIVFSAYIMYKVYFNGPNPDVMNERNFQTDPFKTCFINSKKKHPLHKNSDTMFKRVLNNVNTISLIITK